jgi:hypothetical protein
VKRNRCAPAIGVAILFVGTALTNLNKPELLQYCNNFCRVEDRKVSHLSRDLYPLRSDELTVELGLAILEEHLDNFSQILIQLIKGLSLRVCARKPRHVANVDARVRAPLYDCGIFFHTTMPRISPATPGVERLASPARADTQRHRSNIDRGLGCMRKLN